METNRLFSERNIRPLCEIERDLVDYQLAEGVEEAEVMGLSELLAWQRKIGVRLIELAVLPGVTLSDPEGLACCDWTGLREFNERVF